MTKACIVYFSQTGNTETVAYAISGAMESSGINSVPLQLSDYEDFPEALEGADIIGIGFPTFYGYCPQVMLDLIKGMKKGKSAFVFTTYGGCTAGDSLYDAAKAMAEKGYSILGGLKIEASDNFPQGIELKINAGRPDEDDIKKAEEFGSKVVDAYNSGLSLDPEKLASVNKFFVERRGRPRNAVLESLRKKMEGTIIFKKELCLFCESCKRSCPTKSITAGEKFPEFSWKCIDGLKCYQCVRVCPGKALVVEYPGPVEDYKNFLDMARDGEEEKRRVYILP